MRLVDPLHLRLHHDWSADLFWPRQLRWRVGLQFEQCVAIDNFKYSAHSSWVSSGCISDRRLRQATVPASIVTLDGSFRRAEAHNSYNRA
jgi:hypothetical protein